MKNFNIKTILSLFLLSNISSFCQDKTLPSNPILHGEVQKENNKYYLLPIDKSSIKGSYPLGISDQKTVHLIFPSQIKEVDAGSPDVSVQITESFNNVLKVKSACKLPCKETNLTILTADGGLYSFLTSYQFDPEILNINIGNNLNTDMLTSEKLGINYFLKTKYIDKAINQSAEQINEILKEAIAKDGFLKHIGVKNMGISAKMKGIYNADGTMIYNLSIENKTEIDYNIDFIKLFIKDKKSLKRMAAQEEEIKIIQQYPINNQVLAENNSVIAIATSLQTISEDKQIIIEIYEKNGGRHLRFAIDSKVISKAKNL